MAGAARALGRALSGSTAACGRSEWRRSGVAVASPTSEFRVPRSLSASGADKTRSVRPVSSLPENWARRGAFRRQRIADSRSNCASRGCPGCHPSASASSDASVRVRCAVCLCAETECAECVLAPVRACPLSHAAPNRPFELAASASRNERRGSRIRVLPYAQAQAASRRRQNQGGPRNRRRKVPHLRYASCPFLSSRCFPPLYYTYR